MSNPDNGDIIKKCGKNGFSEKENLKRVKQFRNKEQLLFLYNSLKERQSKVKLRRA